MSCFLDQNFTLDCRTGSTGGLKSMHILGASGNTISGYTTNAGDHITSFSGAGTWYSFQLPKQSASLTETIGVNETSQSVTFQPAISINLPKLDAATRQIFVDVVALNNVFVILEDNNGRYWFVFIDNGGVVSEGSLQSGQSYTDLNGVSGLVISGGEPTSVREIDLTSTNIAALAAAGGFTWNP
jgi:hypothetical protein